VGISPFFVISLCDILCELPEPHGAKGPFCGENFSAASGNHLSRNHSKA
jgi:hypothetical protein